MFYRYAALMLMVPENMVFACGMETSQLEEYVYNFYGVFFLSKG